MNKYRKLAVVVPAFIFAFNILIAISFKADDDFSYMFGSAWNCIKSTVLICIYMVLFAFLLTKLYEYLQGVNCQCIFKISYKKVVVFSFFILLLCYVPYLYAYYPCSLGSDSTDQIGQFFGVLEKTNHHPYFSTLLMGTMIDIGLSLGSEEIGAFLYVIMQTLIMAYVFAYTVGLMVKWKLPWRFSIISLVFYGVTPIWGGYAQLVIKDTMYTAVIVFFVACFLDTLLDSAAGAVTSKKILVLVVLGVLSSLLRNNGIYAVVPGLFGGVLCFAKKKERNVWIMGLCLCVGIYMIWGSVILPTLNVRDGSIREMLSVPFQQTARYVNKYPDEVTEAERTAINAVLDYDTIKSMYTSTVADPVKNTYKEPTTKELVNYFKHWGIMFFKHPVVYIEATVANSYYYYCANETRCMGPVYVDFIYQDSRISFLRIEERENAQLRSKLTKYAEGFRELPVLRYVYSEGMYTYILIAMVGFLYYVKREKYIVGLVPSIMGVLVCIASPVQGNIRYFLPVIACTCICLAFCVKCKEDQFD